MQLFDCNYITMGKGLSTPFAVGRQASEPNAKTPGNKPSSGGLAYNRLRQACAAPAVTFAFSVALLPASGSTTVTVVPSPLSLANDISP